MNRAEILREKEKSLLRLLKLQKKSSALTLELVGVDMQIDEFKKELFLLGANTELLRAMNKGRKSIGHSTSLSFHSLQEINNAITS